MRVRAFVLDMDDTVNRTHEAMDAGLRAGVQVLWPELSEQRAADAIAGYVRDDAGWFERFSTGRIDFPTMRRGRLRELATGLGERVGQEQFIRFEQVYRDVFEGSCRAHDDALRLIDRAQLEGIPLAVLSNSAEQMTRMKVARLGLAERFSAVVSCDQLVAGKPEPLAYVAVCAALGCEPDQVGYVDDLRRDALGAVAAGLQSVWLDRLGRGEQGSGEGDGFVARVTSLDEIELEPLAGR